jgi:oligopeptide/dipeptide ABC transporter ATP-binding protein
MALLLVAHDLSLVSEIADEIVVLYAGVVVERGPARQVLEQPAHPYTRALLASVPPRTHRTRGQKRVKLATIEGTLPDLRSPPPGCRFQDRCGEVMDRCRAEAPALTALDGSGEPASANPSSRGASGGLPPTVERGAEVRCFAVDTRRGAA